MPRGDRVPALALLAAVAVAAAVLTACAALPGPTGAEAVRRLSYPPLRFATPEPERFELSNGVTVFFLRDATLPLVDVFVDVEGGYTYFDREMYAAGAALLSLMRHGGTTTLTPDSLDALIEFHALGVNTYSDGGRLLLGVHALRRHLDLALDLWSDMLLRPRFDPAATERWRVREVDAVRHLGDFPGSLAVLEFNRLLYGDHATGWMLTEQDIAPDRVRTDRLRWLHQRLVCPERAVVGASGDLTRAELEAALERVLSGWRPCGRPLETPAPPEVRPRPGVYVIPKRLAQSTVVVGQPGGVLLGETEDYFASRVANWVIGGGGPNSRLEGRVRTEEGLAYTAASVWGVARDHERIFGAITHTRADRTLDAVRLITETLDDARADPPTADEVALARDAIINGFVFGFGSSAQIVARQVSYLADDLPPDWMARYLDGIRRVDQRQVARVLRGHLRPDRYTILIVGDTTAFDPSALGDYTILPAR
jgi:zinc protease